MISCIVVDDEQHAIDLLTSHISKIPMLELAFATTDPLEAFQYVQQHKTQLIFLDIQMPDLDGMQFTRLTGGQAKIILTTAYPQHALEGYEYDIVDYLLKPILFERFFKAVQKAISIITPVSSEQSPALVKETTTNEEFIFVKTETRNKLVRILLKDIEYIEGMGNYVSVYTTTSRIVTLLSMKELEEKLSSQRFIRVHHSYITPINKITAVEGNQLHIGKHRLPIGEKYKKVFLDIIDRHVLNGRNSL